jgi:hypothetical protein
MIIENMELNKIRAKAKVIISNNEKYIYDFGAELQWDKLSDVLQKSEIKEFNNFDINDFINESFAYYDCSDKEYNTIDKIEKMILNDEFLDEAEKQNKLAEFKSKHPDVVNIKISGLVSLDFNIVIR